MSWIPLQVCSQYSILESTASISKLIKKAKDYKLSSLALTDRGNLYGIVDFFKACQKASIHPILGCQLNVAYKSRLHKKKEYGVPVSLPATFLAMNDQGYHNLCKLSSIGFLEGFYYAPRIDREVLAKYHEGLICLGTGFAHFWAKQDKQTELEEELDWFQKVFQDRFYVSLQRMDNSQEEGQFTESWIQQKREEFLQGQKKAEEKLLPFAKQKQIPLVATNPIHYLEAQDWQAHEILLNIGSGEPCEIWELDSRGNAKNRIANPKRDVYPTHQYYFKSPEQMQALFQDLPEAIINTKEIAKRCQVTLDFDTKHYPVFVPPELEKQQYTGQERAKKAQDYLYSLCVEGISQRYSSSLVEKLKQIYPDQDPREMIQKRLDHEFSIIASKGMCDYLLIVHDFIFWAKKHHIPVGPGRGSAAGSIISYLIGITDIEPLRFHLFFERFINPERISYPDIDVDICMEGRSAVIDYMVQKYGKNRVAQIITFGTIKAKMAIKDVGRVLSVPISKVNQIAKMVPDDLQITIDKALAVDPDLKKWYEQDQEVKRILDIGRKIEGSIRNTSIHAAGLIISEKQITEHIPVCTAKDAEMVVTQYAMKPVESVGMLKIDFLGLTTLTCIQKAVEAVKDTTGKAIDWTCLPLDDASTFSLLTQGKTLGVFQVESGGMQELVKNLRVDHFEEIIAVGALYRPGPMDMIPSFIERKHGREEIEIDHPLMKKILLETYGIMVYQEQVMQIASLLAGYSLGEGDVLRRAMGKKDHAEMARQKEKFIKGCAQKEILPEKAAQIFEKIQKFASYGFNKSHAAAYGYLTYVTAYFKANYPKEWMAALMTCVKDDIGKVAKFIREATAMKIAILPPDVNEAKNTFTVVPKGIRFALSAIKGVGEAVVQEIIKEREKQGSFTDFYDFLLRVQHQKIGKKVVELLIAAGAFDFCSWTRDQMEQSLDSLYDQAGKEQREKKQGILDLFQVNNAEFSQHLEPPKVESPRSSLEKLHWERELLGFYLTAHPMDSYQKVLQKIGCTAIKDLSKSSSAVVKLAFVVEDVQFKIASRSQKKFAILWISDGLERLEIPLFHDVYERSVDLLKENQMLLGIFSVDRQQEDYKLYCKKLYDLSSIEEEQIQEIQSFYKKSLSFSKKKKNVKNMPQEVAKSLLITLEIEKTSLKQILEMKTIFRAHPGKTTVYLHFTNSETKASYGKIFIDKDWGIDLAQTLLYKIKNLSCVKDFVIKES